MLDLTIPEPGSTTARDALSGAIRRAIQELMRLTSIADPELRAFKPMLKRLLAERPGALASVLRSPTIGGLLRCLRRRGPEFNDIAAELIATIYTDLAQQGALPELAVQRRLPKRIVSPAGPAHDRDPRRHAASRVSQRRGRAVQWRRATNHDHAGRTTDRRA